MLLEGCSAFSCRPCGNGTVQPCCRLRLRTHSDCPKIVHEQAEFALLPLLECRALGVPCQELCWGCPDPGHLALCSEQVKLKSDKNTLAASYWPVILREEDRARLVVSRDQLENGDGGGYHL